MWKRDTLFWQLSFASEETFSSGFGSPVDSRNNRCKRERKRGESCFRFVTSYLEWKFGIRQQFWKGATSSKNVRIQVQRSCCLNDFFPLQSLHASDKAWQSAPNPVKWGCVSCVCILIFLSSLLGTILMGQAVHSLEGPHGINPILSPCARLMLGSFSQYFAIAPVLL